MAQRIVDDLDNTQFAERTVTFCLDGTVWDIDLSESNIERLTSALKPFIEVARPRGSVRSNGQARPRSNEGANASRSHKTPPGRAEQLAAVRDWARNTGYEVSQRGRIPETVIEAFNQAHQGARVETPTFSSPV